MDVDGSDMDLRVDYPAVNVRGLVLRIRLSRFDPICTKRVNQSTFGAPFFGEGMITAEARIRFDLRSD